MFRVKSTLDEFEIKTETFASCDLDVDWLEFNTQCLLFASESIELIHSLIDVKFKLLVQTLILIIWVFTRASSHPFKPIRAVGRMYQ